MFKTKLFSAGLLVASLSLAGVGLAQANTDNDNPPVGSLPVSKVTKITLGKVTADSGVLKVEAELDQQSVKTTYMEQIKKLRGEMWDQNPPFKEYNASAATKLQDVAAKHGYSTKDAYVNGVEWSDVMERVALQRAVETAVHGRIGHFRAYGNDTDAFTDLQYKGQQLVGGENLAWRQTIEHVSYQGGWGYGELKALQEANGAFTGGSGHLYTALNPAYKYHGVAYLDNVSVPLNYGPVAAGFYTGQQVAKEKIEGSLQGKQVLEVLVSPRPEKQQPDTSDEPQVEPEKQPEGKPESEVKPQVEPEKQQTEPEKQQTEPEKQQTPEKQQPEKETPESEGEKKPEDVNISQDMTQPKVVKQSPGPRAGQAQEFNLDGDAKVFEVTFAGDFKDLVGYTVDGVKPTAEQAQVRSGSTIFTLTADYLRSLPVGEHVLRAEFKEGENFIGGAYEFKFKTVKVAEPIPDPAPNTAEGEQKPAGKQLVNTGGDSVALAAAAVMTAMLGGVVLAASRRKQASL